MLESCNELIYLQEDCVKRFEVFEKDHFTMMRSISEFIREKETETREENKFCWHQWLYLYIHVVKLVRFLGYIQPLGQERLYLNRTWIELFLLSPMHTPNRNVDQGPLELANTSAQQMNVSRVPPPKPIIFFGGPLKYPVWKTAF